MTMTLVEKIELTSSQASITFSNIPSDGTDLLVLLSLRSTSGSNLGAVGINMSINGLTTNRSQRRLYGDGSGVGSDSGTTSAIRAVLPTSTSTANTFGSLQMYFPNYSGSTNKSFSLDNVAENNSSSNYELEIVAGLWSATDAISSLSWTDGTGANFASGSSATLYKITKGSDGTTTAS